MARVNLSIILLVLMTVFCHVAAAETLKDPTQPPNYRSKDGKGVGIKAAPKWVLSSTLISPARRLATINGKTMAVGERIGDARVLSIESAKVTLMDGNKEIILELLPTDFKRMH